jgi:hypothetical protein
VSAATDAQDVRHGTAEDVVKATRILENDLKSLKSDVSRLTLEQKREKERIKENSEKIKVNRQLPYLVGNVVEVRANHALFVTRPSSAAFFSLLPRRPPTAHSRDILMHSGRRRGLRLWSGCFPRSRHGLSFSLFAQRARSAGAAQVLELPPEDKEEDGATSDLDAARVGKSVVIKTSTRQVRTAQCGAGALCEGFADDCSECTDGVSAGGRPCRLGEAEARRPCRREQGLLSHSGHTTGRVRPPCSATPAMALPSD